MTNGYNPNSTQTDGGIRSEPDPAVCFTPFFLSKMPEFGLDLHVPLYHLLHFQYGPCL